MAFERTGHLAAKVLKDDRVGIEAKQEMEPLRIPVPPLFQDRIRSQVRLRAVERPLPERPSVLPWFRIVHH